MRDVNLGMYMINLGMYMIMCKEIATGNMKIKHHITEYTKTPPQFGIPNTTKVDIAFQTNVIKKVLMMVMIVIAMNTETAIEMARIFGWID